MNVIMDRYIKYKNNYHITLFGRNDNNRLYNGYSTVSTIRKEQTAITTTAYITNTYSSFNNSKIYRFNLNQNFKNIADKSKFILSYLRVPGITGSTIHRTIRLVGASGDYCWDSERGYSSNPIIAVYGEGGVIDQNYFNNDPLFSGIPIPPTFLSKGYIEIEFCTIATSDITFEPSELNDLCISFTIYEPDEEQTNDINLAPKVNTKSLGYNVRPNIFP